MPNGNVGTFRRAVDTFDSFEAFSRQHCDLALGQEGLRRLFAMMRRHKLYLSELYQVAIDKAPHHAMAGYLVWHLSIKRLDKQPIMDWRDLQAIKTQLCGADVEAVQLFPAEARVVDTSNQYHLWAFMKLGSVRAPRLPIGWETSMVLDESGMGAIQRPREGA